jgi:modification methylase
MSAPNQYQMIYGNGADMRIVQDGEADLVLTSPPYFSEEIEILLKKPIKEQQQAKLVQQNLIQFALSLRPVFKEIRRILKVGGALVLQTRDIRYGGFLLGLAGLHREMAESAGLRLVTHIHWQALYQSPARLQAAKKAPQVGGFRAYDTEEFLVFAHPSGLRLREEKVILSENEIEESLSPLWRLRAPGVSKVHPHQSPTDPVRRFIAFYTMPGDLVVDPFAGGGTTLKVAVEMGRRAIGYEIVQEYAERAREVVDRKAVEEEA